LSSSSKIKEDMYPSSNGRITGLARPGKRLASFWNRWVVAAALAQLLQLGPSLHAGPVFDRASFNQISFSQGCDQKQWLLTPDNSLELLLTPSRTTPCEATLEFYFPLDIDQEPAVSFEARSLIAGARVQLGLQEPTGSEVQYSPSLPAEGLPHDWRPITVSPSQIREGWRPTKMASLHFVAFPLARTHGTHAATVMIRNIHWSAAAGVVPAPAPAAPASVPHAVPVAAAPLARHQVVAPARPASHIHWTFGGMLNKVLFSFAALGLFILAIGSRGQKRRVLSPLFEMNMRTWKTHRDVYDVVQFGGFKKVTLSDLKAIKHAGFNAIWLMGVWEVGAKVRDISKNYSADFHGSPYAIYDYAVSSDMGSEQDFRELVQRAHSLRLSVLVDFIPNHMGLDSAWLNDHPEYFIHRVLDESEEQLSDEDLKLRYPGHFPYRTPSYPEGNRRIPKTILVAYGKDPYFYPWIDTAQLDYAQPGLRQRMIDILSHWANVVDGVRCDMAMLTLRDQVKIHRHPEMSWETFNQMMPQEFWTEAIQAVKRVNPSFVFIAETYWSMEGALQNLGFDYTYNKPLYEAICGAVHSGHAEGLMNFMRLLGSDFLQRSVHFLENHDEERAMNTLGEERQRAAATILCTLPGVALLYQGQMEGRRERMPVQRVVPLHQEPEHRSLYHYYRRLLKATSLPVFQQGRLTPLYSNNSAFVSYARLDSDSKVLVIVNTSAKRQRGSIFLMPGIRLNSGTSYRFNDLYYTFKANTAGTIQPFYNYPGSKLINQGLYVELDPFDAHIFVVEPQGAMHATQQAVKTIRQTIGEWPLNRLARRMAGAAFTRSSDTHLAANPAGRQQ
jgi:glycosidase